MSKPKPFIPRPSGVTKRDGYTRATAEEIRLRRSAIAERYAENKTPEQISMELDLPLNQVTMDITYILEALSRYHGGLPPEHTFVRYALFQTRLIRNLQDAADRFIDDPEAKQFNAYMTSMRSQSDIMDKILQKGIDFGVIKRRKATGLVGSSTKVVMTEVHREVSLLQQLLVDIGSTHPITQPKLLDVPSTPTQSNHSRKRPTPPIRQPKLYRIALVRKVRRTDDGEVMRTVRDWKYRKPPRTPSTPTRKFFSDDQSGVINDEELMYLEAEADKERSKGRTPII